MTKTTKDSSIFEEVACPVCSSTSKKILKESQYKKSITRADLLAYYKSSSDIDLKESVAKCNSCGTVYLNNRPKRELIIESYTSAIDNDFISQNIFRIKTFKKQLRKIVKKYNHLTGKNMCSILDIGCAGGAFPRAAQIMGLPVIGIEPSEYLSEWASKEYGLDIRQGILDEQKFKKKSFSMVTLWDVLEHLPSPNNELNTIHQLLEDDGILVINVPDISSLPARIMRWKWPFYLSVHLTYFTPKTLNYLLDINGFKIVSTKPYWQVLSLEYVIKRARITFKVLKPIEDLVKLLRIGHLPISYYLGQTEFVAIKKNRQ